MQHPRQLRHPRHNPLSRLLFRRQRLLRCLRQSRLRKRLLRRSPQLRLCHQRLNQLWPLLCPLPSLRRLLQRQRLRLPHNLRSRRV